MVFSEAKVAQMAAYLLQKNGGAMPHLKLMKLLYFADRKALKIYGSPISGDNAVAMPHGPVLTRTLNLMDGDVESDDYGWEYWVSDKENHTVSLNREITDLAQLDELSDADMEILEAVWQELGHMGKWEIRDYSHGNCPEWRDPNGSSHSIPFTEIFLALGKSQDEAKILTQNIEEHRSLDRLLARL